MSDTNHYSQCGNCNQFKHGHTKWPHMGKVCDSCVSDSHNSMNQSFGGGYVPGDYPPGPCGWVPRECKTAYSPEKGLDGTCAPHCYTHSQGNSFSSAILNDSFCSSVSGALPPLS